jgi:dihydroorotate dehydrogenase electron transfer subunit
MRLNAPQLATNAHPAHFVNVQTDPGLSPFLRRPLSILNTNPDEGWVEIYYDVIGPGTARLERCAPGDGLNLLGPLGLPCQPKASHTLLVGGGVGIVPLAFLAFHHPELRQQMTLLMGAATRARMPEMSRIVPSDLTTILATDDGSIGHHGYVTDLIASNLKPDTEILTCGPYGMMARVAEIAADAGVACYASLENHMACGFGACFGCVIEHRSPERDDLKYRRVCIEGPVMDASQIVWT